MFLLQLLLALLIICWVIGLIVRFFVVWSKRISSLKEQTLPFDVEKYSSDIRVVTGIASLIYALILYYIITQPWQAGLWMLLAHTCLLVLFFVVKKKSIWRQQRILVALSIWTWVWFTLYTTAYIENRLHILAVVVHISLFASLFVKEWRSPSRSIMAFLLFVTQSPTIISALSKTPKEKISQTQHMMAHIKAIFIWVVVLIIIGGIALSLLMSADPIFESYANSVRDFLFGNIDRAEVLWILLFMVIVAPLVLWAATWSGQNEAAHITFVSKKRNIPRTTMSIVVWWLLFLYILFLLVQANYLFSPNHELILQLGLDSYASYVHKWIGEIIAVVLINLVVIAVVNKSSEYNKKSTLTRMLFWLLLLTVWLAVSSAVRLFAYIWAYGLTHERIFLLWGIGFGIVTLLYIWLKIDDMDKINLDAWLLMMWWWSLLAFWFFNIDAIIARYNIDRLENVSQEDQNESFKRSSSLDYNHLFTDISADAARQQLELLQDTTITVPAYAKNNLRQSCEAYENGSFLYYKVWMDRWCEMVRGEL